MQGSIRMGTGSRQEYLAVLRERYRETASRKERSQLIEEAIRNTGLHRKSVIRVLNHDRILTVSKETGKPEVPRLGRKKKYSAECLEALKKLYRASDYQCSDKLKHMIPILLDQGQFGWAENVLTELQLISPASIDRYLHAFRSTERRRRNTGTRPGSKIFKRLIPIKSLDVISSRCGYLEADTVAHCGGNMGGEFVWSLTITDTFSGWTSNRATYGKHAKNVLPAIHDILTNLAFNVISMNVDNGSEFLNHRLYEYFTQLGEAKTIPFPMSRSRSYHKNDNAHVEQKNWTHVRQVFGYERLESREFVALMNEIYLVQNLIQNFFIPQFKLKSKVRILAKIKKKHDAPKTPCERVLLDPKVSDSQKRAMIVLYQSLNYFKLKDTQQALIARFIQMQRDLKSKNQVPPQEALLTASR
jgi:hypothetical protein